MERLRTDVAFLALAIHESGMSYSEIARKSGVTREHISNIMNHHWKNSKNSMRVDTLVAILGACGFELRMEKKDTVTKAQEATTTDPLACPKCGNRSQQAAHPMDHQGKTRYCIFCITDGEPYYF